MESKELETTYDLLTTHEISLFHTYTRMAQYFSGIHMFGVTAVFSLQGNAMDANCDLLLLGGKRAVTNRDALTIDPFPGKESQERCGSENSRIHVLSVFVNSYISTLV